MLSHSGNLFWSDARMPYVETRKACTSRTCYKSHSHETFSIGAVDAGFSCFSSAFHQFERLTPGSLVVVPAFTEHSCNPLPNQDWSYQMMHLDASWLSALIEEGLSNSIEQKIPVLKPEIIRKSEVYQSFCKMNETLFNPNFTVLEKEQQLIDTLIQFIFPSMSWRFLHNKQYLRAALDELINLLNQHQTFLSLEELAQSSGLSRFTIIRLFKQNLGLTPHAFQLNLRIHQARQQLKTGKSITAIAYDLGFSDQSHFHRVFKQFAGATPRQYQLSMTRNFIQDNTHLNT